MATEPLTTLADIQDAQQRIRGTSVRTGLYRLDTQRLRAAGFHTAHDLPEIWLKAENEQPIGSFKLRGAYNKIAALSPDELRRGVITYSSGNHAQGVAYAARELGARAVIVMPEGAPRIKRDATLALGAEVVLVGPASTERKQRAEALVAEHGCVMIPPYDDAEIIAGQATCGLEIAEEAPDADLVLSPVSGGGLLSGVATAVKLSGSHAQVRNFRHILRYVDGILTVTEEEIPDATRLLLLGSDIVPEPSGAVTLAAALFHAAELPAARKIVAIVSGGNIDPALREELLLAEA